MANIDVDVSFTRFVYPFRFDPATFEGRAARVTEAVHQGDQRAFQVWQEQAFPASDLLPHVAAYLNPPAGQAPAMPTATARQWEVPPDTTLRSLDALGAHADWALVVAGGEIPFRLTGIQLALFGVGVGFLTLSASPKPADIDAWLRFLHDFRFARRRAAVQVRALQRRRAGLPPEPYIPKLVVRNARISSDQWLIADVLAALLVTATLHGEVRPWWRESFVPGQLLAYAALYVDEHPPDEDALLLYRLRHFFGPNQGALLPAEDRRIDGHSALLPYAERMWFVFSLEGAAFVACDAPPGGFFREQLPDHLGGAYFLLFLLALHQRFVLTSLSEEVASHWPQVDDGDHERARREAEQAFRRINSALLAFTARGYFAQVMQGDHHHRCYRKWQDTFQIGRLYQEVSDEVRAMDGQLRLWRTEASDAETRRLTGRLNLLGLLLGGPALALAFADAVGPVSFWTAAGAAAIGLASGAIVLAGVTYVQKLWARSTRRDDGARRRA